MIVKGCKAECIDVDKYPSKCKTFIMEDEMDFKKMLDEIVLNIKKMILSKMFAYLKLQMLSMGVANRILPGRL